jgi:hypothetical protein
LILLPQWTSVDSEREVDGQGDKAKHRIYKMIVFPASLMAILCQKTITEIVGLLTMSLIANINVKNYGYDREESSVPDYR